MPPAPHEVLHLSQIILEGAVATISDDAGLHRQNYPCEQAAKMESVGAVRTVTTVTLLLLIHNSYQSSRQRTLSTHFIKSCLTMLCTWLVMSRWLWVSSSLSSNSIGSKSGGSKMGSLDSLLTSSMRPSICDRRGQCSECCKTGSFYNILLTFLSVIKCCKFIFLFSCY